MVFLYVCRVSDKMTEIVGQNGRVNESKLFQLIYGKGHSVPIDSVPNPSAQSLIQCCPNTIEEATIVDHYISKIIEVTHSNIYGLIIELQGLYGLRISEVLGIKPWDISRNGNIKITPLKGSNIRVVRSIKFEKIVIDSCINSVSLFEGINRFAIYRLYKTIGCQIHKQGDKRSRVTHALRHHYYQGLKNMGLSTKEASTVIGQKSKKSGEWYERK